MKRSASALGGPQVWDAAPPVTTNSHSSFRPPYTHYAIIYLDQDGKLKIDESSSIQEQNATVFNPEFCQNFLQILGESIGYYAPIGKPVDASPRRVRRRKVNGTSTSEDRLLEPASDSEDFSEGSTKMIPLRIGDTQQVMSYYENALNHFQQLNCRMVVRLKAHAWW
ncbi:uncharacterized protein N7511_011307 [Penicillium nucicola]|uniref:uncharacterized protein n=1 Tax=Penicillium nucicola TaxID=1850975 RepID=UPI0025453116|nr:uncharacterized protein N7511_011307 [Penicillium nucicola]KAJ5742575.1 hypothetical protein N7511_011307 [Penicillium nucicola]